MLDTMQTFRIPNKEHKAIEITVNWNDADEVAGCRMLKMKIDNGAEYHIKTDDLHTLMLMIGSVEMQKQLLPMKLTQIKRYETELEYSFAATKDYRKGERIHIKAPYVWEIPLEEMIYSGNIKTKHKKIAGSGIIVPNKAK